MNINDGVLSAYNMGIFAGSLFFKHVALVQ